MHTCMISSSKLESFIHSGVGEEDCLNGYPLIESFLQPKSLHSLFFLCIFYHLLSNIPIKSVNSVVI